MPAAPCDTSEIQAWLDRLRSGDESARRELIRCSCARLTRLARKMLRSWPRLHRWEDTEDVLHNALLRLNRALRDARPAQVSDYFRLAALQIRHELQDLAKHYYGPQGPAAHHVTPNWKRSGSRGDRQRWEPVEIETELPPVLAAWSEFHAQVAALPDQQRAVFDLLWYQGLRVSETAQLLGITARTVKRRWAAARLRLHQILERTLLSTQ